MSLESVFKLSVVMNMIDNLSRPMSGAASKVNDSISTMDKASAGFGELAKTGAIMQEAGSQIVDAVLAPVEATFDTRRALGELSSLGVEDLNAVEQAARSFSDQWSGTTKSDFISAAYDIKSGIASLSEEGVADMTALAALTAKATKSTASEMTSLFASGYGIYKQYYDDLSDIEFGEMFSAGIAQSVKQFKTTGSGMAQSIQTLGGSATTANVPLEEQLSILGMLQATMSGSEAGTKYRAFLRSAAKGGEALGLSFMDANNQLLSMPEILDILHSKFGDTIDAAEKMEIQKAFGDTESVALIDLMYNKVGDLQDNIVGMYDALGSGTSVAQTMASAINETEPERYQRLHQQIHNVTESIGQTLLPTVNELMSKGEHVISKVGGWIERNQALVRVIMIVVLALGGFLAIGGTLIAVISGVGLVITKTVTGFRLFKTGLLLAKGALTPLIASVWSFTAALLANPITWVVIGVVALIAVLVLLYNKCEWFRNGVNAVLDSVKQKAIALKDGFIAAVTNIATAISQKFTAVKTAFSNGITMIKNLVAGAVTWFFTSGQKIVSTFANGIRSAFSGAVNAVKNGLQRIRNMLPFSDAKEGPLSTLTLSGQRTMTTYAHGLTLAQNAPATAMEKGLSRTKAVLDRDPIKRINLNGKDGDPEDPGNDDDDKPGKGKTIIIQKLVIQTDIRNLKDLDSVFAIINEVEDFSQGNGVDQGEYEPVEAG